MKKYNIYSTNTHVENKANYQKKLMSSSKNIARLSTRYNYFALLVLEPLQFIIDETICVAV